MTDVLTEFNLKQAHGIGLAVQIDNERLIVSRQLIGDIIILQLREGYDDDEHAKQLVEKLEKRFEKYEGHNLVIVIPPHVKLLKPVESLQHEQSETCPHCGVTLRAMNKNEMVCLTCGFTKVRRLQHLADMQTQLGSDGGVRNL